MGRHLHGPSHEGQYERWVGGPIVPTYPPADGTTGQVLAKTSDDAYDMAWTDAAEGGGEHPDLTAHDVLGVATQGELDAHESAPDPHTGYALTTDLSAHEAASDPHAGYQRESEKGVANGYASLDGSGLVPDAQIPSTIARDSELPDLAGHLSNPTGAHAASAISIEDAGNDFTATEVEGALAELQSDNEARHPSAGEKAALAGTSGTPSDSNRYVTDAGLDAHEAASDPHPLYALDTDLHARQHSITSAPDHTFPGGTTFLRADGQFASPPGGSEAFPVGSVFIAVVSTNPATLLGYGTWAAFAAGRMLVGLDSGDTDFDTVEETGGAKTVTLTAAQSGLPEHTHDLVRFPTTTGSSSGFTADTSMSGTPTAVTQDSAGVVGGAQAAASSHQNLPPYIVVYMWERTA